MFSIGRDSFTYISYAVFAFCCIVAVFAPCLVLVCKKIGSALSADAWYCKDLFRQSSLELPVSDIVISPLCFIVE